MYKENVTLAEKEKCRIEIEMNKQYYGAFATNVLNSQQNRKVLYCEEKKKEIKKRILEN